MAVTAKLLSDKLFEQTQIFDPYEVRPSAIASCARKQVYQALGYPANETAMRELQGVAYMGHIIEEALANLYSKNYPGKTYRQFELTTPYGIKAHADIWVPARNTDIEVKSVSVGARYYGLPKDEHFKQLMLRLHFHHKYRKRNVKGEIVYFFRETLLDTETMEPVVIAVEYDPSLGQELETRLCWILECIERKTIPPREGSSPEAYPCKSKTSYLRAECPYRELCWADELEETPAQRIERLKDTLEEYAKLKEMKSSFDQRSKAVEQQIKKIEELLSEVFEREKTDKIAAGQYQLKRTYIEPGRVEYEREGYYRYYLSKIKEAKKHG